MTTEDADTKNFPLMAEASRNRFIAALNFLVGELSLSKYVELDTIKFCTDFGMQPRFLEALRDLDCLVLDLARVGDTNPSRLRYMKTEELIHVSPEQIVEQMLLNGAPTKIKWFSQSDNSPESKVDDTVQKFVDTGNDRLKLKIEPEQPKKLPEWTDSDCPKFVNNNNKLKELAIEKHETVSETIAHCVGPQKEAYAYSTGNVGPEFHGNPSPWADHTSFDFLKPEETPVFKAPYKITIEAADFELKMTVKSSRDADMLSTILDNLTYE